jgi:hypothetical protein
MAVRVRVDFEAPPVRIMLLSYIFIGRLGPDRELVGLYNEDKEWKVISDGPPGAPTHIDIMGQAARAELTRLDKKVAAEIDKLY